MRTRCPVCNTVFRVTSEQLRLKAGKVRCGHCQAVFNAFDELLAKTPDIDVQPADRPVEPPSDAFWAAEPSAFTPSEEPEPEPEPEPLGRPPAIDEPVPVVDIDEPPESIWPVERLISAPPEAEPAAETSAEALVQYPALSPVTSSPAELPGEAYVEALETPQSAKLPESCETPEATSLAAREAGLVAARELNDAPGYSRWAAGTLASNALGGFADESPRRAVWPFVMVALLLLAGLFGQLLYHFRTDVVLRWPSASAVFEFAAVNVKLPRNSELVSIEASDLQSDNVRGLLILQATLHNRASYAQAWPALELTLTDTNDTVVSRRVLMAADYLPPATDLATFPANGETAIKLWIEANNIGAAGYRLYIFYP
jgi:predicted Zn finger-like uncharacterized protein